jgi:hypothetical protein
LDARRSSSIKEVNHLCGVLKHLEPTQVCSLVGHRAFHERRMIMRKAHLKPLVLPFALALTLGGCMAREQVVADRPAPSACPEAFWVDSHYERDGQWYPAYWECPALEPGR